MSNKVVVFDFSDIPDPGGVRLCAVLLSLWTKPKEYQLCDLNHSHDSANHGEIPDNEKGTEKEKKKETERGHDKGFWTGPCHAFPCQPVKSEKAIRV